MAHLAQREFLLKVKKLFPDKFANCCVLDIGSLDINGNNRYLFKEYNYIGIDIGIGKNVDIVCPGHLFKSDKQFDIVISTECFEHDMHYKETINNAISLTKPDGMLVFTCATTGRAEHGTEQNHRGDSPYTNNYYKNLTEADIRNCVDVDNLFSSYVFEVNHKSCDLYFWGIKGKESPNNTLNNFKYRKTDKFDLGYIKEFYDDLFIPIKDTTTKILELGINKGESIKLWRDFFLNATVYGLDIRNVESLNTEPRVIALTLDAYSTNTIELMKKLEPDGFDIIIDDGPHTLPSMQFFLKNYTSLLKKGGVLILEDIIDISWTKQLLKLVSDTTLFQTRIINMASKALTPDLIARWQNGLDIIIVHKI